MSRLASYTIGLILALVLTITAFSLALAHVGSTGLLGSAATATAILVLAFAQLAVQLYFFLHLGLQKEARWNMVMFAVTFSGILVIVGASIWIMYHLNYNMTPQQMNQYINSQSGL